MPKKTDEDTRRAIVDLREQGHTYREIERELDVSAHVVAETLHEHGLTDTECSDPHCTTCNEARLDEARQQGYEEGRQEGYDDGFEEGYELGKQEGQWEGRQDATGNDQASGVYAESCPHCEGAVKVHEDGPTEFLCPHCEKIVRMVE